MEGFKQEVYRRVTVWPGLSDHCGSIVEERLEGVK